MFKEKIMPTTVLGAICLVVALLLSVVNMFTGPIIEKAQAEKANAALAVVLPGGTNFTELPVEGAGYPASVTAAYKADNGFVFRMEVTGYKPGLIIMCGINSDGTVAGADFIASNETLYAEVGLGAKFVGYSKDTINTDIIAGPTAKLTTGAYYSAIEAALNAFIIANGGTVDLRDPAQILQDNCNAALGTEGLEFTRWFATEVLEGIDAVYEATESQGYVYVIGESFIGVDSQGAIVTENVSDDNAALVNTAHTLLTSSTETEITELDEKIHSSIVKVSVTNTNNYIFEVKANGFSVYQYNEYSSGDNAPIIVKVAISADGKIIDCRTLSQSETKAYGDACATEDYYDSWRGVGADEVVISSSPITGENTDPGAISGATHTSKGYQQAIKRAFEAFEILGGENK